MGGDYLLEGGQDLVMLLILQMASNWMVGGKGSARDGRGLSIRGWWRNTPAPASAPRINKTRKIDQMGIGMESLKGRDAFGTLNISQPFLSWLCQSLLVHLHFTPLAGLLLVIILHKIR